MRIILCTLLLISMAKGSLANNYRINHPLEIDSLLVAWLIDRYVETGAHFILAKKSQKIDVNQGVISVNTGDSPYRRGSRHTAFDMALKDFSVENKCIDVLQRYNKILEITPWRKLEFPDAHNFEKELTAMFPEKPVSADLYYLFSYLDDFCTNYQ